jgi:arylsulfatase A-like enzyme
VLLTGALLLACAAGAATPPNFVIILADDLGYGDLGCYGHPSISTPNLDRMAAEGMRLTDFYVAACVCTPSRAALLTGRLPIRSGMSGDLQHRVQNKNSPGGLPPEEITIARALKGRNYATACIGKWHLGHQPQHLPLSHGFDYFYGLRWSNDMEPARGIPKNGSGSLDPKLQWFNCALMRNHDILEQPTDLSTLTRRYTAEAVRFIEQNRKQPFFLYFPHTYPHVPLFASPEFKQKSLRGLYGDVVEELDWSVGQVLTALRKHGLAKNTFVFFTSDNGPWITRGLAGGSAGLLRDGKGSTWEGGMREPALAWWPGRIKAGSVNHEIACSMDLFNTCLALAGVPIPNDRTMDGVDLSAMFLGKGRSPRELMFYYNGDELYAVRKGDFKAHLITWTGYSKEPPQKRDTPVLFDLPRDPGERFDVAAEHPAVVADILREVDNHRAKLVPGKRQY